MKAASTRPGHALVMLAGLLAVVSAYLPGLSSGFVSDDFDLLLGTYGWSDPFRGFFRPLPEQFILLMHDLFGLHPLPFHLFSLLLHLSCMLLVRSLARKWGATPLAASWAATFFGLLFIASEAVFWMSGLTSLFLTFFYLLALITQINVLKQEGSPGIWWTVLPALGAFLSKESAVTLPLAMAMQALMVKESSLPRRQTLNLILRSTAPTLGVTVLYLALKVPALAGNIGHGTLMLGYPLWRNLRMLLLSMTTGRIFPDHLFLPLDRHLFSGVYSGTIPSLSTLLLPLGLTLLLGIILVLIIWKSPPTIKVAFFIFLISNAPYYFIQHALANPFGPAFAFPLRWYYLFGATFSLFLALILSRVEAMSFLKKTRPALRLLLPALAAILILVPQWLSIRNRSFDWVLAGRIATDTLVQAENHLSQAPPREAIILINPPDSFRGAYILRNGLWSALTLRAKAPLPMNVLQGINTPADLSGNIPPDTSHDAIKLLWYANGAFTPVPVPTPPPEPIPILQRPRESD